MTKPTFLEFFAGGGMARAGLGDHWDCVFANDFDEMKVDAYRSNWGADHILFEDVANLCTSDVGGEAKLCWASFPCQDLSLAGNGRGLGRADTKLLTRSGTFWPFWRLIQSLDEQGRIPNLMVLENVLGLLTSRGGKDFVAVCDALSQVGYSFGAVVLDAKHFVPQSRKRVFFVAVSKDYLIPNDLTCLRPDNLTHPDALRRAQKQLSPRSKMKWIWWNVPMPSSRSFDLIDVLEESPTSCNWHDREETNKLLAMMSGVNLAKVAAAKELNRRVAGTLYKRTRIADNGLKEQRAEVRFDGIAGCLRTPGGGSSRQTIVVVEGGVVRTRLLSTREAARLMGLADSYKLPERYNDAYKISGDGVCVPVVRHIRDVLLDPIQSANCNESTLIAAE